MTTSVVEPTISDDGSTVKGRILALPTVSSQTLLVASLCFATLLVSVIVFNIRRRSSSRRSEVLLVGPCGSGKTAILTTLIYNQTLPTHTSLQANSSVLVTSESKRQLKIVDIPGHPRIRDTFKEHLQSAKAVVFVVDASTVTRNGALVAEHLHHVLHAMTSLPPTTNLPPLLILAHKSDLLNLPTSSIISPSSPSPLQARTNLAISRIRTVLERELEKRRLAQRGGVSIEGLGSSTGVISGSVDDSAVEMGGLDCRPVGGDIAGSDGAVFRFSEWEGGEVEFLGTWVKVDAGFGNSEKNEKSNEEDEETDGLGEFRDWLEGLA